MTRSQWLSCCILLCFLIPGKSNAQDTTTSEKFYGFIFNKDYEPIINCHVINLNSGYSSVSDKMGYFSLSAKEGNYIIIKNIAYHDTILRINEYKRGMLITLKSKNHEIPELKIFSWGNSYNDLKNALLELPNQETMAEKLGFAPPDPNAIPFFLDENKIKNPALLLVSPVSYLYYNLSRRERIIRKAHRYKKNEENRHYFNAVLSKENIQNITKLEGEELEKFLEYLNKNNRCDHSCQELEIISEIYFWWKEYCGRK